LPQLRRLGHHCEVAALWPPYDLAEALEQQGIVVHRLDLPHRWHVASALGKLEQLCRRHRFEIMHAHLFFAGIYTAMSKAFLPQPRRAVSFHNLAYESYPANTPWKRARKSLDSALLRTCID